MIRPATYMATLLIAALVAGLGSGIGHWAVRLSSCRMLQHPGAYLAYCDTPAFGSYEHEAYALNSEPAAVAAMQNAEVLFLGNSRTQFAFSTREVDRFFAERAISYHVMGFGYGESSALPRYIFKRHPPRAKVVVINADPFFQPVFSPAAVEMLGQGRPAALADAILKREFGRWQFLLCGIGLCAQTAPSTYRDTTTGRWIWHDVLLPAGTVAGTITDSKALTWSMASIPAWTNDAQSFLAGLPVRRPCVILTGVPSPAIDSEGMASELGQHLGLTVIQPETSGLTSLDNSHLSADSAERWSGVFLAQIEPIIDRCLKRDR